MQTDEDNDHTIPSVRLCKIYRNVPSSSCGFHLSRTKWDPYPWIGGVEKNSPAESSGLKIGDCVLEINGEDIIGMKMAEVAQKVQNQETVTMLLWNAGNEPDCDPESICCAPMPTSLSKLSRCLTSILSSLECPVCLEVAPPPAHQCPLGHLICFKCHAYTDKCPICRTRFNKGRSILADKIYETLIETFELKNQLQLPQGDSKKIWDKLFGRKRKQEKSEERMEKNSPDIRNKFLSRLVGKCSSVENLTSVIRPETYILRKKSLSSNEIYFPNRSRCLSSNYSSFHNSSASVNSGPYTNDLQSQTNLYRCPSGKDCRILLPASEMVSHMQESHEGPMLQYTKNEFTIKFPLSFEDLNIITMKCYGKLFLAKILQPFGDIKVHIWLLGTNAEASSFKSLITVFSPNSDQNTELTFKTFVMPLDSNDLSESIYKEQVIVTKSILDAYFADQSFSLNVSIISIN